MASPAFRGISSASGTTRDGTVTVDKPTGTVDNDIMLCFFYVETDNAVSTPAGWSAAVETVDNNGTSFPHRLYVYWKRASSEGANYTFTWTGNVWQEVAILSYSGCITSGSPIDISTSGKVESVTGNQPGNDPDIFPTLSFTTTVADTKLVYFCICSYIAAAVTPPTNFVERGEVSEFEVADKDQAAAGGSGNVVSTQSTNNIGSTSAIMVALKPPAGGATPLTYNDLSESGTVAEALTGQRNYFAAVADSEGTADTVVGQYRYHAAFTTSGTPTDLTTGQQRDLASFSTAGTPTDLTIGQQRVLAAFSTASIPADLVAALYSILANFSSVGTPTDLTIAQQRVLADFVTAANPIDLAIAQNRLIAEFSTAGAPIDLLIGQHNYYAETVELLDALDNVTRQLIEVGGATPLEYVFADSLA